MIFKAELNKYIYTALNSYFPTVVQKKITLILALLLIYSASVYSQRYSFRQYTIQDGLAQSQVTSIAQDGKRRLWLSTLGGISCFNGKEFCNLTKSDGLNYNYALSLTIDKSDNILIGTARDVEKFNGEKLEKRVQVNTQVYRLATENTGAIYGLTASKIFRIDHSKSHFISISGNPNETVTALKATKNGEIWTAVNDHGIYIHEKNTWKPYKDNTLLKNYSISDFLIDRFEPGKTWFITTIGILILKHGQIQSEIPGKFTTIEQDAYGGVWLGSEKGAYRFSKTGTIWFNRKNGFTDNTVYNIFLDAEKNIWLSTDGEGLFKFNDNNYVTFDESQGLLNKTVTSLSTGNTPGETWIGTYSGLFRHQNGKITEILLPSTNHQDSKVINFLYKDNQSNTWIGTVNNGLWCYNGKNIQQMINDDHAIVYNTMLEDSRKRIWLTTNIGTFLLNKPRKKLVQISKDPGNAFLETNDGEILLGTQDGVYKINTSGHIQPLLVNALKGISVLTMIRVKELIMFGSADNGLIIWNTKTGKIQQLNIHSGLISDHIYSLMASDKGFVWIGTGKGIQKLSLRNLQLIRNDHNNSPLVECNQNAIIQSGNEVWVGTTKGAIVYQNEQMQADTPAKPYVFINSISAFMQKRQAGSTIPHCIGTGIQPGNIVLPYSSNNINIRFTGIFLTNPDGLLYQYRMLGFDNKFCDASSNTAVNYTAIPPGKYTFEVRAITSSGIISLNTASFHFEITPPYYQTTWFRLLALILIILFILLAVYTIINLKERKRKLRLKIKLEEQFKVRKQTAEDFHDDLGNKLTRISVLSEVLSSMIDQEDEAKRNIIVKINENVNELYRGTKDILWSLNPKNDKLSELMNHIGAFGKEMFNETPVLFREHIELVSHDGKLALDISRNLLMIFKEAIHNTLKHSKAGIVIFSAMVNGDLLEIAVIDDGEGMNTAASIDGHGINNMKVRAKRINAKLSIISNSKGTTVWLSVHLKTLFQSKNV